MWRPGDLVPVQLGTQGLRCWPPGGQLLLPTMTALMRVLDVTPPRLTCRLLLTSWPLRALTDWIHWWGTVCVFRMCSTHVGMWVPDDDISRGLVGEFGDTGSVYPSLRFEAAALWSACEPVLADAFRGVRDVSLLCHDYLTSTQDLERVLDTARDGRWVGPVARFAHKAFPQTVLFECPAIGIHPLLCDADRAEPRDVADGVKYDVSRHAPRLHWSAAVDLLDSPPASGR